MKKLYKICALGVLICVFLGMFSVNVEAQGQEKKVYLTFDDGPSKNTEKVLNILKSQGVNATFFVVGPIKEEDSYLVRRAYEEGNSIGNHTYDHDFKYVYKSEDIFWQNFNKDQEFIKDMTGSTSKLFRFPGGSKNRDVKRIHGKTFNENLKNKLEAQGVQCFDWDIDSGDGLTDYTSANTIYNNIINQVDKFQNPIILMHDSCGKKTTLEALPSIIKTLKDMGYTFDTLDNYK